MHPYPDPRDPFARSIIVLYNCSPNPSPGSGLYRAELANQIMMELMKETVRIGKRIFSVLSVPVSFALVGHLPLSGSLVWLSSSVATKSYVKHVKAKTVGAGGARENRKVVGIMYPIQTMLPSNIANAVSDAYAFV
jgi:hypothetical protein